MPFQSSKVIDGFSTVFRQWKAVTTPCQFIHGYDISFKLTFEGPLDERNWVWDFGGFKRASTLIDGKTPKDWFSYMFDHTTVLAEDDPELEDYKKLKSVQLRIVPAVGCEKFSEFVFNKLKGFFSLETNGRVRLVSVECREHEKNSATYYE